MSNSLRFSVYVIELDRTVTDVGRFKRQNPTYTWRPGRPPLYVGSSVLPPEARIEQHRSGYRSSRAVREHFHRPRPDLYERGNWSAATRARVEYLERRRAETLRRRGYGVWQG